MKEKLYNKYKVKRAYIFEVILITFGKKKRFILENGQETFQGVWYDTWTK